MVMRNRCSSGKVSLMEGLTFPMGKSMMTSARANPFQVLGVENSRSNSCRIMIHLVNIPVISDWISIYFMGLELGMTLVLHIRMKWRNFWAEKTRAKANFSSWL